VKKRFVALSLSLSLLSTLFFPTSLSNAADPRGLIPQPANTARMIFADIPRGSGEFSYVNGVLGQHPNTSVISCKGIKESGCENASSLMLNFIVPPCTESSKPTDMCIKELSFANSAGKMEKAKLLYEVATPKILANQSAKTPAGGGISVWQGPAGNNSGGTDTYGVQIGIRYNIDYNPQTFQPGVAYVFGFEAEVIPVSFKSGSQYKLPGGFQASDTECAWNEDGKCAVRQEFGSALPISLSFQMDSRITGWLSGRMKDTGIDFSQLTPSTNLLTVTGTPIDVPMGYADLTEADLAKNPAAKDTFTQPGSQCVAGNTPWACGLASIWRPQSDRLNWQWGPYFQERFRVLSATPTEFAAFEAKYLNTGYAKIFQQYLKTFPVRNSQWKILGLDRSGFREGNWPACITDSTKFNGIVTTNAMLNDVSPARFEDGSLIYDVAGAHEAYDGSVFKGTYDLVMSSSVARCLYNFTSAPIKATISIIASDGTVQSVATEAVSERNGWLSLSAKNFTFSAPTIKIKLSQESTPTPTPTATPTPVQTAAPSATPAVVKKLTITCVKGKTVKKVTAVKPTCPAGYKKK
jgi:hypothetical protein